MAFQHQEHENGAHGRAAFKTFRCTFLNLTKVDAHPLLILYSGSSSVDNPIFQFLFLISMINVSLTALESAMERPGKIHRGVRRKSQNKPNMGEITISAIQCSQSDAKINWTRALFKR